MAEQQGKSQKKRKWCVSHTLTATQKVQDTVNVTLQVQGTVTLDKEGNINGPCQLTIATVQTSLTASKNG